MLISTPNRALHVLHTLQQTETVVSYVCTDMAEEEPKTYLLNGYLRTETYQRIIPLVLEQKSEHFTDLADVFSSDGIFFLLFRWQKGVPLLRQCKHGETALRLEYTRRLLEQIVLQDMPLFFQYAVLTEETVLVTEDGQVRFSYVLPDADEMETVSFHGVEQRLLTLIRQILYHELEMRYSPKLLTFCMNLSEGGVYTSCGEWYAAFYEVIREFQQQGEHPISRKYRFQLWEACKRQGKKLRRILIALILLVSGAVMLYETFGKSESAESDSVLTQIGTLVIRENQPTQTTTTESVSESVSE